MVGKVLSAVAMLSAFRSCASSLEALASGTDVVRTSDVDYEDGLKSADTEYISVEKLQDAMENIDTVVNIAENTLNLAAIGNLNRENKIVLLSCTKSILDGYCTTKDQEAMEQLGIVLEEELKSEDAKILERQLEWINDIQNSIDMDRSSQRDYAPCLDESHPEHLYAILNRYVYIVAKCARGLDKPGKLEDLWVLSRDVWGATSAMDSYSEGLLQIAKELERQICNKWESLMGYA
ncbi:MAG: hypothetical protein LBF56_00140 [Holosporales bacterium]|jgi:hypothetical protein|nr:hypothetical protein [Holosporales bacterium]